MDHRQCVGRSQPPPAAAAAAVGLALLAQDRRTRRSRLLPSAPDRLRKQTRIALTPPPDRVVIPFHVRIEVDIGRTGLVRLRAVRDIADTTLTALELKALD